jgi:excisionase family DNA binding protein
MTELRYIELNQTLNPVKAAAARLGISVWTLRKLAYSGEVASVKIGVKLLIPETEIERLIRDGSPRSNCNPLHRWGPDVIRAYVQALSGVKIWKGNSDEI